jgi:protein-tyrosine phosphatase
LIDLHTHILPGVDDGVKTEDEAVEFARVAVEDGVRQLVATPHCKEGFFVNERDRVLAGVARLTERLRLEDVPLEILPGAEVHLAPDLLERVRDGRALTLADNGRTLLLELSTVHDPPDLESSVRSLIQAGIQVLLAHPERIRYFQDDLSRYETLVRLGAYGQVTTGSVLGVFGEAAREASEILLRRGLLHVLASDAHNLRGRPPRLAEALDVVAEQVGEAEALKMVIDRPLALLAGLEPDLRRVRERRTSRWLPLWWRRVGRGRAI